MVHLWIMSIYQIIFSFVYNWFRLLFANHMNFFVALKGKKMLLSMFIFFVWNSANTIAYLTVKQWPMYFNINRPTSDGILKMFCKHAILSKFFV
jgi:hypothetical protein